ncbi:hypothetical protein VP01_1067g3 [Puccinia sorghi]|uniref:DDE Tnp4 domain-containing protein n=1 Tax=Puccinia sorghi TaxID=27349 RepID=A0A0L6VTQ0_9BASI|nr:hypothetical protein VP01_1067g3 [Puccinia sorghi]
MQVTLHTDLRPAILIFNLEYPLRQSQHFKKKEKSQPQQITEFKIKEASLESLFESDSGPSSDNSGLEELVAALISIKKRRYLAKQVRLEQPPNITNYLFRLDTASFKQEFWMSQESFLNLVLLIEGHPVFQNNSNIPQRPVRDQLTVTVRQMGMFGNSTSAILSLERCVFFCFYFGFDILIDAWIPIRQYVKPMIDPQDYYSQKGMYGLATLIVCNEEKQIIYYLTGRDTLFPGLISSCRLWLPNRVKFGPSFQKTASWTNTSFVQFQLLQGLRLELMWVESMERITQWVGACVILHNKTPSISMADEDHSPSIITDNLPCRGTNSAGNNHCEKVFQEVLSHLGLNEE